MTYHETLTMCITDSCIVYIAPGVEIDVGTYEEI